MDETALSLYAKGLTTCDGLKGMPEVVENVWPATKAHQPMAP